MRHTRELKEYLKRPHFMSLHGNGKLKLYNAFPRNYSTMAEATADLDRIGDLGFNVVWINPLNATSKGIVKRFNHLTGEDQEVRGSLYAGAHFDRLNYELFPDLDDRTEKPLTGNPAEYTDTEKRKLVAYTDKARENRLQPIFDLVLNHVALDSPLVTGECTHFKNKGIDTSKWFLTKDTKWDDVCLFNYDDPVIREEIIQEFWLPYLRKYINEFGFDGVRIDFAGGRFGVKEVEKVLCDEIRTLVAKKGEQPVIFAELLPPAKKLEKNARELRELYTHVTNKTLLDPENSDEDIKIKQQTTHLMLDGRPNPFPVGGTVGFAASHDKGSNARNSLEASVGVQAAHTEDALEPDMPEQLGMAAGDLVERAITMQLEMAATDSTTMTTCLLEQRKRLAICALVSDGGFYLLAGDEFGKLTPASVFVNTEGKSVYDDERTFNEAKQQSKFHHIMLIKNLNAAISEMPRATYPHWAQTLHLPHPYNQLVVVMNYNGEDFSDPKPVLSIVNLSEQSIKLTDDLILKIAQQSKLQNKLSEEAFKAVLKSVKQLIGPFESASLSHTTSLHDDRTDITSPEEVAPKSASDRSPSIPAHPVLSSYPKGFFKLPKLEKAEVALVFSELVQSQVTQILENHSLQIKEYQYQEVVYHLKELLKCMDMESDSGAIQQVIQMFETPGDDLKTNFYDLVLSQKPIESYFGLQMFI